MIESRTDQPRTSPVAFLRNSVGVSPMDSVAMCASAFVPLVRCGLTEVSPHSAWPARLRHALSVDEDVFGDFPLLGVQIDDRALEHAVAVPAAGIGPHRPAHALDSAALVNVAVHRKQRLVLLARVPDG